MSKPFPEPEPGLDRAVRAHLDAESARVNAGALWAKVLGQLEAPDRATTSLQSRPRPRFRKRVGLVCAILGLAAALFLVIDLIPAGRDAVASPAQILEAVRDAPTRDLARCYRVTLNAPPRAKGSFPILAEQGPRTLCTRGDRFVVEPGFGGKGAWGRTADGRIWVAPSEAARAGVSFTDHELPPALRNIVKIYELELTTLLNEILVPAHFDLVLAQVPHPSDANYLIHATRKEPGRVFQIDSADLSVEKGSNQIQSLILKRKLPGESSVSVTFDLMASVPKDDSVFTPEGHLAPGKPVYDATRPILRGMVMMHYLGGNSAGK